MSTVCVTGGTGYIGSRLIPLLTDRGHEVRAVVRPGSEKKIPGKVSIVAADPLIEDSYTESIRGCDTFVHLIGVPHPSPAKAAQFRAIDLPSVEVAAKAAGEAGIRHFIYLSVAHPALMMEAFIAVRAEGEALLRASAMPATFVRPWYVLGPGHWWPYALLPFYRIAERLPRTRESALRLGLVTISQMLNALVWSVDNPPSEIRILDVPRIRELSQSTPS
ncbi:MAG TPA: NAD(P)H-binding protein [Chthoniobacterales bacterium]|nr:NAD(P)H-binding protein [Chthoniobacterales bacterium]